MLKENWDFADAFFGQLDIDDAVAIARFDLSPKIGDIDRDKSGLGNLAEQRRNGIVLDDGLWTQRCHRHDLPWIPSQDGFDDASVVQVFIQDDHRSRGGLGDLRGSNESAVGKSNGFDYSIRRKLTAGIFFNDLLDSLACRD